MSTRPSHHGPAQTPGPRAYANDTLRSLNERAGLRSLADRPSAEDVLQTILEAGTHAATGGDL